MRLLNSEEDARNLAPFPMMIIQYGHFCQKTQLLGGEQAQFWHSVIYLIVNLFELDILASIFTATERLV